VYRRVSQDTSSKVLHSGWRGGEGADDRTPLGKQRRLPESHGVVFQRVPEDLQDVALGGFDGSSHGNDDQFSRG
jgi:hypothetical protein